MASFSYLWSNRVRFPVNSLAFYRCWAKRMLCMFEIIKRNRSRSVLIKNGACIDPTAEIGEVKAEGHKSNLSIGAYSFLGNINIALHEEVFIGKNVCINDGVQLLTASHDVADPQWNHIKAKIIIDDYAWIATNAIILPGVHIGKGAVVGAGAVVSRDVASGVIVAGNPAKPISKTRCKELNYNPCEFLAGNRAWLVG
jgi:acetyltransferase-like isoleucine patch superfamily enzyme